MVDVANQFKAELANARETVATERDKFDGTVDSTIQTKIQTDEGWVCTEADIWTSELAERCQNVRQRFQDAWDDVNAAYAAQPDEVPEDDWRARRSSHH